MSYKVGTLLADELWSRRDGKFFPIIGILLEVRKCPVFPIIIGWQDKDGFKKFEYRECEINEYNILWEPGENE